jgi:hypothetical protein
MIAIMYVSFPIRRERPHDLAVWLHVRTMKNPRHAGADMPYP